MKKYDATAKQITISRQLYQNPYAHLNGAGEFGAITTKPKEQQALARLLADSRLLLQDPYAYLNDVGEFGASVAKPKENAQGIELEYRTSDFSAKNRYAKIARKARELQLNIWKKRKELWPEGVPSDPVQLLNPSIAIKSIGFKHDLADELGDFYSQGSNSKIAGIIDRSAKRISISRSFPHNTRRFTAAHELGHALLHRETLIHRDRPIDGSARTNSPRDTMEIEADKFATYFLMPEKLIRERFEKNFYIRDVFVLTDDTAFALDPANPEKLNNRCKTPRDLTRILANTERYNGRQVNSLAAQFGVSGEAMAIRIEELGLVEV